MRPRKNTVDWFFPTWNPQRATIQKATCLDKKLAYKSLRSSSSNFIKKKQVRDFIFKKFKGECALCKSKNNLQVDHIVTVYQAVLDHSLIDILNSEGNLRLVCATCNSTRNPRGDV